MGWFSSNLNKKLMKIMDGVCLSLLWLLFSLPLVTIGAATSALYYAYYEASRNEDVHVLPLFLKGFKRSFKQTTAVIIGSLLSGMVCFFYTERLAAHFPVFSFFSKLLEIVFIYLVSGFLLYSLSQLARFRQPFKQCLKNSVGLTIGYFIRTIGMLSLVLVAILTTWLFPLAILFIPTLVISRIVAITEKNFQPLMRQAEMS